MAKKSNDFMTNKNGKTSIHEFVYVNRAATAQLGFYVFDETFTNEQ